MKTLVVVPCGSAKIWKKHPAAGPTQAEDAYIGTPFKLNRAYAEKFGDKWVILSAKFGLIDPDYVIHEDYNVTFNKKSTGPVSLDTVKEQVSSNYRLYDKVIGLGGKNYEDMVLHGFEGEGITIELPTRGLSLGYSLKKIKEALRAS